MTQQDQAAPPNTAVDVVLSLGSYDWSANGGSGDAENPYMIFSVGQLDCLAYRPDLWDRSFRLANALNLKGRVYNRAILGHGDAPAGQFNGTFDGDGHLIKNVTIEGAAGDGTIVELLAFFGKTGPQAQIIDLGLMNVSLTGTGSPSCIAGMLCGDNGGIIKRCFSRGTIRSTGEFGGFVGRNTGVIEDCYAQGSVEDMLRSGGGIPYVPAGFVARNISGTIDTCYSTCLIRPDTGAGLVASNEEGVVERCVWDVEVSGVSTSAAGNGLETQELMSRTVLQSNGWGGNPNWILDDGKDYPRLIWEGTPGNAIPPPSTTTRGGGGV